MLSIQVCALTRSSGGTSFPSDCRPKSLPAQSQIVPMDHLGAAFDTQQQQDIARRPALDLLGIAGVVGHETATDLGTVWTAHHDGIAAGELPIDPNDTARSPAFAAPE